MLHRAQILLEAEQHQALAEIADQEGRSISELVREIVRQHLAERHLQDRQLAALRAVERLTQIRATVKKEQEVFPGDPLAEVRAEWEKDVERMWRGEA